MQAGAGGILGGMSATTIVAIYAAVVSTGLLLVALASLRANRTRVVLKINPGTAKVQGGEVDDFGTPIDVDGEVVYIQIANARAFPPCRARRTRETPATPDASSQPARFRPDQGLAVGAGVSARGRASQGS